MKHFKFQLFLLRFLFILGLVGLAGGALVLFSTPYDNFAHSVLAQYGKLHRLEEFKEIYLTPAKFMFIQYSLLVILNIYFFSFSILWKKSNLVLRYWQAFMDEAGKITSYIFLILKNLSVAEKYILGGVVSLLIFWRVYHLFALPITYDEAYTYLNFSSKSVLVSASHYRSANNHILFSIVTNFFTLLPIDPTIAIRLPSLIAGLFVSLVVFLFIREYFTGPVAIVAFTLFSFSYPISLYSIHARGYIFLTFFFILSVYSMVKLIFERDCKVYWFVFLISSILGFYTIPTFLYPYLTLLIFGFSVFIYKRDRIKLKHFIFSVFLTSLCVIVLFSPVFLISGANQIINNENIRNFDSGVTVIRIFQHFDRVSNFFFGMRKFGFIPLSLIGIVLLIVLCGRNPRVRLLSFFCLLSLVMAPLFLIIQRVLPPRRAWVYLLFPLVVGISFFVSFVLKRLSSSVNDPLVRDKIINVLVIGICLIIIPLSMKNFTSFYKENYGAQFKLEQLANVLLQQPLHYFYINDDQYDVFFTYLSLLKRKSYKVDRNIPFDENRPYDCLVVLKDTLTPQLYGQKGYKLFYEDWRIQVFQRITLI